MRMIRLMVFPVVLVLAAAFFNLAHADKFTDTIKNFKRSPAVQPFFKTWYGYAVFPRWVKADLLSGELTEPAPGAQAETDYRKGMVVFVHAKGVGDVRSRRWRSEVQLRTQEVIYSKGSKIRVPIADTVRSHRDKWKRAGGSGSDRAE